MTPTRLSIDHSISKDTSLQIDRSKASEWVYPENVPTRQYQVEIVKTALFNNTLVCLPTGLGKTLIAAVVMYNYYNWFPQGKVVFLAPTKPLVDQQKEACLHQVAIKQADTAEMTGHQKPELRKTLWAKKRVFFCTPQVFEKDLAKNQMSVENFVCVVVDECHKSTGNFATVGALQRLRDSGIQFRIVGLSATPGRTHKTIQEVINNLMIKVVEFRDENDPEISQHTHEKAVEALTVYFPPELTTCYKMLYTVMERVISPLLTAKVWSFKDPEKVTRYGLVSALQEFKRGKAKYYRNATEITSAFNDGIFLTSLSENLDCGIRIAWHFIQTSMKERPWLRSIPQKHPPFKDLSNELEKLVSVNYEHPKIRKLMELLQKHFNASPDSRVIIFTSLRDTVSDIVTTLEEKSDPRIQPRIFIGQGNASGKTKMTQKDQKQVLEDFRKGKFNTLVATCIAEEGLDIPEVQLIICFDGAASPLRDTQRKGRTGRHGAGKVIYLLSEGKERRKYDRSQSESGYLKGIVSRASHTFRMCEMSPRMVPNEFDPIMKMVYMDTTKSQVSISKRRKSDSEEFDRSQTTLDSFVSIEDKDQESTAKIIFSENAKMTKMLSQKQPNQKLEQYLPTKKTTEQGSSSSGSKKMKISENSTAVYMEGAVAKKVPTEVNTSAEKSNQHICIARKQTKQKELLSSSSEGESLKKSVQTPIRSGKELNQEIVKNQFLDLSASVSSAKSLDPETDDEEEDELEDFIDDSIPKNDSVSMMRIYRSAMCDTKSPKSVQYKPMSSTLTPGVTPFSQQSDYESSFVTDGSGD